MTVSFGLSDDFTKQKGGRDIIKKAAERHKSSIISAIEDVSAISADGIVVKRSRAVILATEIFGSDERAGVSQKSFKDSFDNLFLIKFSRILKELKSCKSSLKRFKDDLEKPATSIIINYPSVHADSGVNSAFKDAESKASYFKGKLASYKNYLIKNLVDKDYLMYGKQRAEKK